MSRASSHVFERMAVLGLGLLGGSTALAARRRGVVREVRGYARRRGPLVAARAAGVIDEFGELSEVVADADLILLGTPVGAMASVLDAAAPHLRAGAVVTDVGSVKGELSRILPAQLPEEVSFVGSHPMAGSHVVGVEHADSDLFAGRRVVVTPTETSNEAAVARVVRFWEALGARVVCRSPEAHDDQVAWVSHLPHLVAYGFALAFEGAPEGARELTGTGFRDFTRIARSDPEMWSEILASNQKALAGPLHQFSAALASIANAVEADDTEALVRLLASAQEALAELPVSLDAPPMPGAARSAGIEPKNHAASTGDARRLEGNDESS